MASKSPLLLDLEAESELIHIMTNSLDCIALSLSVPRPRNISGADIIAFMKAEPDTRLVGLVDSFFTEVSRSRIAESVREGHFTWAEIARTADAYGLHHTQTAIWFQATGIHVDELAIC